MRTSLWRSVRQYSGSYHHTYHCFSRIGTAALHPNAKSKHVLRFSTSHRNQEFDSGSGKTPNEQNLFEDSFLYHGPLSKSFRNLKIFSLSSVGLTLGLTPILFVVESGLPMSARISLAAIAVGTSGLSTSLIAWCAKPYVTTMRRFRLVRSGSAEVLELTTQSLFLKPLITKVYDPSFLIESRRPFAQWELAKVLVLSPSRTESVGANVHPEEGIEETVAETRTADGTILGRWIVKWGADGAGTCHQMGHVVRYFNVHEELLQ